MADDFLGLSDLATINDRNIADYEMTDLLDQAPLLARLNATIASNGTSHKYLKETGAPVVGFRAENAGREHDSSIDTLVTITLKILDASHTIDQALADAYKGGAEALLKRESGRHLKAAFSGAEKQIFYGTGSDAGGFAGLADNAGLNGTGDTMVVNAGGSTALTSIYVIHTRPDETAAALVIGQSGNISIGESVVQRVTDGSNKYYPAYFTPITAWLGMQIGSAYDVARICNVGTDTGKGATDALIYDALSLLPAYVLAEKNNILICMNRRSCKQLRASRTATNATGAPAPFPTEVDGYPVIVTDSLLNSETAVT